MMHGREKSDSAIVAGTPTNKAVPTAAEPVEPRAGAKGNASQQSTHRTQGRERVSQALEGARQAAQRKKEKFTALLHNISIDSLRMAFLAVKRDGAPLFWDRGLMAFFLTFQNFLGAFLGVASLPVLSVVLTRFLMPTLGHDLLDIARTVAALDLPMQLWEIFARNL